MVSRVSEAMKGLLEKRRIIKRDNIKNVDYSLFCRLPRRRISKTGNSHLKEVRPVER